VSRQVSTSAEIEALPAGAILRGENAVAVREGDGWVVSGYIYPRTHEDFEEFIGSYPLDVVEPRLESVWVLGWGKRGEWSIRSVHATEASAEAQKALELEDDSVFDWYSIEEQEVWW